MLRAQDALIVNLFKMRVQAITRIERMIVFGSRARGDAVEESDLDIFIEVPSLTPDLRQKILDIAWEISYENEVVISTFLTSTALLTNSPLSGNPIIRTIELEGVAV